MLDICILGSGGSMPTPDRYLSATLIRYQGRKILIDCGEGTQVSMKMVGWGFKTIDTICITHYHADHILGLSGLLLTIGNSGREEPLTIIGPKGITEVVNGLRVIAKELPYEVNIIEDPKEIIKLMEFKGIIELSALEVDHSEECLGYSFYVKRSPKFDKDKAIRNNVPKSIWNTLQLMNSVEHNGKVYTPEMVLGEAREGIKISYITDTRPIETIPEFIENSDLLICEGTYAEDKDIEKAIKNKHMTFSEAATLAKEGSVKELIITHLGTAINEPEEYIENATNIFKNTKIAQDRMILSLNFAKETQHGR